jgi:hypothetical protein
MAIDQITNSAYQKNAGNVGSQYKVFYNEEQETDEEGNLLEPTAADPIAAPTTPATDPKAPQAPTDPAAAPTDPKAPTDPNAPPADPQDTVDTGKPPAGGGGQGEAEVVGVMAEILAEKNTGNMKLDKMVEALKAKGFDAKLADTGRGGTGFNRAEIEVIASDGTKVAFKDEDGDSQIGMVDEQFRNAVQTHAGDKYDQLVSRNNQQQAANKQVGADGTAAVDAQSSAKKAGFVGGAQDGSGAAAAPPPAADDGKDIDPAAETGAATATTAPAPVEAPKGDAAPADAKASVADPVAAIGERINSGEQQKNAKGEAYKYQVKDANIQSCPRGKPKCTCCGQCIKGEIVKAQGEGAGAAETAPTGQATGQAAGQTAAVEEAPEAVQAAPQAPQVQGMEIPQAATFAKNDAAKPAVNQDDIKQTLKMVQEYLDSMGFVDKTAEDLLADGQLGQIALQLGINVPEHIA